MLDSSRPYPHMPALSKFLPAHADCGLLLPKVGLAAVALLVCPAVVPFAGASVHRAIAPVHRAALSPLRARGREAVHVPAEKKAGKTYESHIGRLSRTGHPAAAAQREPRGGSTRQAKITTRTSVTTLHGRHWNHAGVEERDDAAVASPRVKTARAERANNGGEDTQADIGTRDRVHAWYKTHTAPPATARLQAERSARTPDVATAAPKATIADFDRAAAAQRSTIRSAAEQNSRQTTAADDAADAESQIPSTAPTAREPEPFVHGEDPSAATAGGIAQRAGTPIVRQTSRQTSRPAVQSASQQLPATGSVGSLDLSTPAALIAAPSVRNAHPDLSSGALGRSSGAVSLPDARALATIPVATAGDSSARAVRAIALETAASSTPRLQLPSPPVAGRKPAIAAVQAASRHPVLDPAVSDGMADETFDGDDVPATAATAIRLATTPAAVRSKAVDDASTSATTVAIHLFDGEGHLALLPPMRGSHEILVHQNQMAVADGLERIGNDRQLADMHRLKLLVDLPDDDTVYPNDVLPLNRRYARPWTVRFIRDLARAHYTRFGTPLIVTSAVRTVEFQRRLVRINGNAAPPTGDIASPHLYGQAVDFAKRGMSLTEITWMRAYLGPVEDEGKIDVEEEFQQACFHISVYRRYLGAPPAKQKPLPPALLQAKAPVQPAPEPAQTRHHLPTALLATHLP